MADVDEPEVFAVGKVFVVVLYESVISIFFILEVGSKNFLPGCAASLRHFAVNVT